MIQIDDLTGIPEAKRKQAIECLDDLLTFKDSQGILSPIITGYNLYTTIPNCDSMISFSNIHGTEDYKQDMLTDLARLGYNPQIISGHIRKKGGAFLHDLGDFRIRDDNGNLLPGLRIKDIRSGKYLDLDKFTEPLINYPQFRDAEGYLIDEDYGWELDMPFNNKKELMDLVSLFLKKSGEYLYDEDGEKIVETYEEKESRSPWADAYKLPVLLLGEAALRYADELPHFVSATKVSLRENSNEISFTIHKNLETLRSLPHYKQLLQLGFEEEGCLGNKPFIKYVDKTR